MNDHSILLGIGINDSGLSYKESTKCPYFIRWRGIIRACVNGDCTVCNDWMRFSNFKSWMETQDWKNNHLNKNLLNKENSHYSPDTCVFVPKPLSLFLNDRGKMRGQLPIGVTLVNNKSGKKYSARCQNPFTKQCVRLGNFSTPEEAHDEWRKYKHKLACDWGEMIDDERIKDALVNRFK